MHVLLVQPRPRDGLGFKSVIRAEPLGLEIVAGALTAHQVKIVDLIDGRLPVNVIQEFAPRAVGISCSFTVDTYQVVELARAFKQINPQLFVFVGGHHASLSPEDFFDPAIDAVVVGEGETTTPEMLAALEGGEELSGVQGLVLNRPEGQFFTGLRPLLANLDEVPFPRRSLVKDYRERYFLGFRRPLITVETSRGCPFRCNFCSVWRFQRGKFRAMSPERVLEELAQLPPGDVLFTDDNFLTDVNRAAQIAALIKGERLPARRYIIQARSDTIVSHPEIVAQWKEVGLNQVFIGFEKMDQEGLEQVDKRNSVENNERALKFLQRMKIGVYASFIVDPQFTRLDFQKLREYIRRLKLNQPYFSVLTPLPGTELFDQVKERITSFNYDLFDLLHAVLPTKLPLSEFYRELAGLYRWAYGRPLYLLSTAGWVMKCLLRGKLSLEHLRHLWYGATLTARPGAYLQ